MMVADSFFSCIWTPFVVPGMWWHHTSENHGLSVVFLVLKLTPHVPWYAMTSQIWKWWVVCGISVSFPCVWSPPHVLGHSTVCFFVFVFVCVFVFVFVCVCLSHCHRRMCGYVCGCILNEKTPPCPWPLFYLFFSLSLCVSLSLSLPNVWLWVWWHSQWGDPSMSLAIVLSAWQRRAQHPGLQVRAKNICLSLTKHHFIALNWCLWKVGWNC